MEEYLMSRKELQKDETFKGKETTSGKAHSGKGRSGKKQKAKEGKETTVATNRLGSIVDITKFIPVGYPGAASDVVPINFGCTLSTSIDIMTSVINNDTKVITDSNKKIITPGVCAIDLLSTIGPQSPSDSDSLYNAINECANSMYAHIRMSNAGGKNYDPSDLVMYIYAVSSAYALHGYLRRLYGIAKYYNYYNNYTPDVLMKACGWGNPGLILNNMTTFRDIINTFGRRLAVFPVPTTIPIVDRMAHLYDDVYLDSDSERAQMYVFRPSGLYVYNDVNIGGLKLDYDTFSFTKVPSFSKLTAAIDAIIQPILESQSLGEIKRDILATYPSSSWYVPEEVQSDYLVIPKLDYNVLLAIHNCTVVDEVFGDIRLGDNGRIYQEVDRSSYVVGNIPKQKLIDLKGLSAGSVNAGAVLMGTMFTSMWDGTNYAYSPEVVQGITIYYDYDSNGGISKEVDIRQLYQYDGANLGNVSTAAIMLTMPFEYFPMIEVRHSKNPLTYFNTGFDAYRIIDCDDMMRINRMKMEGLFGLPYHFG